MFLKGECADFPDSWSDRMWGPDDLPNQRTQYELRRAAVRICEACPVRAECLAFGIMVRDQYGIYGGLPLRARRQVLKTAREAGFRFDPNDPNAEQRLARFIRIKGLELDGFPRRYPAAYSRLVKDVDAMPRATAHVG